MDVISMERLAQKHEINMTIPHRRDEVEGEKMVHRIVVVARYFLPNLA
jgi:hypothetical protein